MHQLYECQPENTVPAWFSGRPIRGDLPEQAGHKFQFPKAG